MGADNSFYVKFIANYAPTFFGYIISDQPQCALSFIESKTTDFAENNLQIFLIFNSAPFQFQNGTKSLGRPYVETYWESYLSFPYNGSNCIAGNLETNDVNEEAFGYDLKQIPVENIDVVNIGFLSAAYDP